MSWNAAGYRLHKACDACKSRKARCKGQPGPCEACVRRKLDCHFSAVRTPRRPNSNFYISNKPPLPKLQQQVQAEPNLTKQLPEFYIDRLISHAQSGGILKTERSVMDQGPGLFAGNYSLTFFSDSRLRCLSKQLKNNKIKELVERISAIINSRVVRQDPASSVSFSDMRQQAQEIVEDASEPSTNSRACIDIYFERLHPIFPFLDRTSFESVLLSPQFPQILSENKAWSALYHSILAIGCQLLGCGSFEPGKGLAWRHFSIALSTFTKLMVLPDSLTLLQAMAAMAVFSLGVSCLSIEHVIVSEAARRAQNLARFNIVGDAAASYHRVFWVIYTIEKISSFYLGRTSLFMDHDIVFPIPATADIKPVGSIDWFLIEIRYSRLLSRAMTFLFAAGALGHSPANYLVVIDQLSEELESWRLVIPAVVRPGALRLQELHQPFMRATAVWLQYLYNSFRLSLCRAVLHLAAVTPQAVSAARNAETIAVLMQSSRSTLELTAFIDVEPHTPLHILGGIPLTSLFVLFDFVISNPKNPETAANLTLLEVAAGHFSRLEYVSGGCLPGSPIAEFAYIAREYVNTVNKSGHLTRTLHDPPRPATEEQGALPQMEARVPEPDINLDHILEGPAPPEGQLSSDEVLLFSSPSTSRHTLNLCQTLCGSVPEPMPFTNIFDFPVGNHLLTSCDDLVTGINVMNLFNATIPGIDPFFLNLPLDDSETYVL